MLAMNDFDFDAAMASSQLNRNRKSRSAESWAVQGGVWLPLWFIHPRAHARGEYK
jgi:hypothetical protein